MGGASLVAAPLAVLGLLGATVCVATVIWGAWPDHRRTGVFWVVVLGSGAVAAAAWVAARGCFVEVDGDRVRDVVAWRTVHSVDRRSVVTARVARGVWRWFVLELDDGRHVTLVGACPQQWPLRLAPAARDADLADLDDLLGDDAGG